MLQDIAKQEHGCLVTGYFNLDTCTAAHILVGNTLDISAVLLCIIDKICEKQAFSPKEYCEMLMREASDKKENRHE
jgi:hypothetical protein